jgi:hypothetical protein
VTIVDGDPICLPRIRRKPTWGNPKTYVGNFRFQRRKFKALGTGDILLALTRDHEPPSRLRHGFAAWTAASPHGLKVEGPHNRLQRTRQAKRPSPCLAASFQPSACRRREGTRKRGFPRHEKTRKRLLAGYLWQPAGTFRVGSCPAKAGFVSDDATTPEGFGMGVATGEAKPQARARRSWRISSQDDTAHRRLSWSRVSASNGEWGRGFNARSIGGTVVEPILLAIGVPQNRGLTLADAKGRKGHKGRAIQGAGKRKGCELKVVSWELWVWDWGGLTRVKIFNLLTL